MSQTRRLLLPGLVLLLLCALAGPALAAPLTPVEQLGKALYFDKRLSEPNGMACADCHLPRTGYAEPDAIYPVSEGRIKGLFGNRNAPTSAYTGFGPNFGPLGDSYQGGQFWDGRATGDVTGLAIADQAMGPFLNPIEMANPDKAAVVADVARSSYAWLFTAVYPDVPFSDVDAAYEKIAWAIGQYELSDEVNTFSSKFDAWEAGATKFSAREQRGYDLFVGKAGCAACHPADADPAVGRALFTDFTYDNLGLPKNPEVVALFGEDFTDLGLGGRADIDEADELGKFKVPTLRNIAQTSPYGHNGYFATLLDIVHFYNTRDVPSAGWPEPEVADNVNTELGELDLTATEERDIVAFLETLSDGWQGR